MPSVSYSSYTTWKTCPLLWKLKYKDNIKDDAGIHQIFGRSIHLTIQEWLSRYFNDNIVKFKLWDVKDFFKDALIKEFELEIKLDEKNNKVYPAPHDILKQFYFDGCDILDYLVKNKKYIFPTKNCELLGCEIPLDVPLTDNLAFKGYIDIIIYNKEEDIVYIYDLKTSGRGWFKEKKDPKKLNQLLLYKNYYSKQFDVLEENIVVEFIILKRKLNNIWDKHIVKFEPSNGKKSVQKAITDFQLYINECYNADGSIRIDNIKPTPSKDNCRFCPFKSNKELCPVGIDK